MWATFGPNIQCYLWDCLANCVQTMLQWWLSNLGNLSLGIIRGLWMFGCMYVLVSFLNRVWRPCRLESWTKDTTKHEFKERTAEETSGGLEGSLIPTNSHYYFWLWSFSSGKRINTFPRKHKGVEYAVTLPSCCFCREDEDFMKSVSDDKRQLTSLGLRWDEVQNVWRACSFVSVLRSVSDSYQ